MENNVITKCLWVADAFLLVGLLFVNVCVNGNGQLPLLSEPVSKVAIWALVLLGMATNAALLVLVRKYKLAAAFSALLFLGTALPALWRW